MTLGLCLGSAALVGCRGDRSEDPPRQFFPDMDDSPKWKPQSQSGFFPDGRAMRPAVPGVVAFGSSADPADPARQAFLRADESYVSGLAQGQPESAAQPTDSPEAAAPEYLARIPARVPVTEATIRLGAEKFNIYCSVCHGYEGDGLGTVGRQWSIAVPNFHDPKYSDPAQFTGRDGYIYYVARNGLRTPDGTIRMPGYGHALSPEDAWSVVAYIRALQQTRLGTLEDIPTAQREAFQKAVQAERATRSAGDGAAPAPAGAPAPQPTPSAQPTPPAPAPAAPDAPGAHSAARPPGPAGPAGLTLPRATVPELIQCEARA
ncbi:MAG: hypothetical protein C0513_05175 [Isosphaera sp.]|nr:hypothetical protein [Isosphaera sp.]